jgi:hypothetical protein
MSTRCFVFGSNEAGIHGAGSAAEAFRNHGAYWGVGFGPMGGVLPRCYAIPTKDRTVRTTLPLDRIAEYVEHFRRYAEGSPDVQFDVVAIGTGLAGYTHAQMAPLFAHMPANVHLPAEWAPWVAPRFR